MYEIKGPVIQKQVVCEVYFSLFEQIFRKVHVEHESLQTVRIAKDGDTVSNVSTTDNACDITSRDRDHILL